MELNCSSRGNYYIVDIGKDDFAISVELFTNARALQDKIDLKAANIEGSFSVHFTLTGVASDTEEIDEEVHEIPVRITDGMYKNSVRIGYNPEMKRGHADSDGKE